MQPIVIQFSGRWVKLTKDKTLHPEGRNPVTIKKGKLLRLDESWEKYANHEWARWRGKLMALYPDEIKYMSIEDLQKEEEWLS